MFNVRGLLSACAGALGLALLPGLTPAHAITFGFSNITNNGPPSLSGQLFLDVTPDGSQVKFTFRNMGPVPPSFTSSIEQVYFEAPALLLTPPTKLVATGSVA